MNILEEICIKKREHVDNCKLSVSIEQIKEIAEAAEPVRPFARSITGHSTKMHPALIAEVKKASPSKGIIRKDFDPVRIAQIYELAGACCLSVLTDTPYFQGCDDDLRMARSATGLPVLRKDFIIDPYQVYESRAIGADCILLIMAALDNSLAKDLYGLADHLGMDVLVEVHNMEELERAIKLSPEMIGVNNRNLETFEVELEASKELAMLIPEDIIKVAESGIKAHSDIEFLQSAGFVAYLVGEALMKQEDITGAVKKLLGTN
jgi:indole-3-glycerol phosphate synthase